MSSVFEGDHAAAGSPDGGAAPDAGAPESGRAARRVLLVGERFGAALAPRVAHCAPAARVGIVPSFLFAMGEAGQQPVDVVVASADELAGMAESASRCLRELLPESRLVVVADTLEAAREADAAVRGGFDLRLDQPVSDDALCRALGEVAAGDGVSGARQRVAPSAKPGKLAKPGAKPGAESVRSGAAGEVGDDHASDSAGLEPGPGIGVGAGVGAASSAARARPASPLEAQANDAPSAAPDAAAADAAALGDVDLVEALLAGHDQFESLAFRLIAQRSGIADLAWARDGGESGEAAVPAGHAQAPVAHRGRHFGVLHAPPPAAADGLAGWAGWLGRWLALGRHLGQLETLAMTDELTGAWNRRYFNRFLLRILEHAQQDRSQVTLLVFDIDDFKLYNDRYGHGAGDEILREAAKLMNSFVREHDVVARIGGDEFAVIFWDAEQKRRPDSAHPHSVRQAAERFQKAICAHHFPKLLDKAPGTLTISGGLACYPWDGRTPEELLALADAMALQSKRQGKNAITFGPGALRACNAEPADHEPDATHDT